jgi:hypothetical protein
MALSIKVNGIAPRQAGLECQSDVGCGARELSGSDLVGRAWRTTHQHKLHDENGGAATARKERVSAVLCGVPLLLSAGLGNAMDIDTKSFRCITKMTPVRQFYVDNLRGNLDATLAAANSATGAVYRPGSVIQLIPTEAMVKQDKGFNAATHDWEFFELDVSKDGTQIRKRGTIDVVNRFGGNCFGCHVPAAAQWDLVCESGHGWAPLEVTHAMTRALQRTDPRCDNPPITPEDAEALEQLEQLLKAPG